MFPMCTFFWVAGLMLSGPSGLWCGKESVCLTENDMSTWVVLVWGLVILKDAASVSFCLFAFLKDPFLVYPWHSLSDLYQVCATMPAWLLCKFSSKRIKILGNCACIGIIWLSLVLSFSLSLLLSTFLQGLRDPTFASNLPSCAEYDLELLNTLTSTFQVLKLQAYAKTLIFTQCWGSNSRLSCMLGKHSTNWAPSLSHYEVLKNW